jgi:MFS family permease
LPSFLRTFGTYNATTKKYVLDANVKSAMNSIPFAGQALGAFLSSFFVDWFGYKVTMIVLAVVQVIAVIIELTCNFTGSWGQFTVGRFLAYVSTGLAEMAVTHYNSEVSPAATRGLLAGSMLFFNALGNLWGAGMSRAYATETGAQGWIIPQAVQFIPAILILLLIWFTPESPRWLVLQGKKDEALISLNKLRPKRDVDNGLTQQEINAIEESLEEAGGLDQGRWIDLFRGNMLRRTWISWSLFVFLQFTGIQFVNR